MADALDDLYAARPQDFTSLRTKLAAEAKKRGDTEAAKQISAARKPTTAAWVVNKLVHSDGEVRRRLSDLGERLRSAHADMDGPAIRELSGEQRRLVDEMTRAALDAAAVDGPAALRDDVTSTLQAAVADPDVAARLGRLVKAEQWSGFGEFGDTATVLSPASARRPSKPSKTEPSKPEKPQKRDSKDDAAARAQQQARAELAAAERAKAETDDALAELQSDLATARLRQQDAQRRLREAEEALAAAEDAYEQGKRAGRDAAAAVKEAKQKLKASKSRG